MADPRLSSTESSFSREDEIRWMPYNNRRDHKGFNSEEAILQVKNEVTSQALSIIKKVDTQVEIDALKAIIHEDLGNINYQLTVRNEKQTKLISSFSKKVLFAKKIAKNDLKLTLLNAEKSYYETLQHKVDKLERSLHYKTFDLPKEKPNNIDAKDWAFLKALPQSAKKGPDEILKFSRRKYTDLKYSYLLTKEGELHRLSHKTKHPNYDTKTEKPLGEGAFKIASNLYDDSNKDTMVRATIKERERFQQYEAPNQRAYDLFGKEADMVVGKPFSHKSKKTGEVKLSYLSPKLIPADKAMARFQTLANSEKKQMLLSLYQAVEKVHDKGLAHRDIKPENLMTRGNKFFLYDFDSLTSGKKFDDALGTPNYQPPSMWRKGIHKPDESKKSDLYAVAVVGLQLFSEENFKRFNDNILKMLPLPMPNETTIPDSVYHKWEAEKKVAEADNQKLLSEIEATGNPTEQILVKIIRGDTGFTDIKSVINNLAI